MQWRFKHPKDMMDFYSKYYDPDKMVWSRRPWRQLEDELGVQILLFPRPRQPTGTFERPSYEEEKMVWDVRR